MGFKRARPLTLRPSAASSVRARRARRGKRPTGPPAGWPKGADREGFGGRPLLVVGVARNASFAWAAAAGALTVRGEAVLALAVAGTYLLPLALLAAAPLGRGIRRLPSRRRPAWGAETP